MKYLQDFFQSGNERRALTFVEVETPVHFCGYNKHKIIRFSHVQGEVHFQGIETSPFDPSIVFCRFERYVLVALCRRLPNAKSFQRKKLICFFSKYYMNEDIDGYRMMKGAAHCKLSDVSRAWNYGWGRSAASTSHEERIAAVPCEMRKLSLQQRHRALGFWRQRAQDRFLFDPFRSHGSQIFLHKSYKIESSDSSLFVRWLFGFAVFCLKTLMLRFIECYYASSERYAKHGDDINSCFCTTHWYWYGIYQCDFNSYRLSGVSKITTRGATRKMQLPTREFLSNECSNGMVSFFPFQS